MYAVHSIKFTKKYFWTCFTYFGCVLTAAGADCLLCSLISTLQLYLERVALLLFFNHWQGLALFIIFEHILAVFSQCPQCTAGADCLLCSLISGNAALFGTCCFAVVFQPLAWFGSFHYSGVRPYLKGGGLKLRPLLNAHYATFSRPPFS